MSFNRLQIRFQTARSLPAPYAYFYTLTAKPARTDALQVDLAITYTDRNDIDDDELMAEGYTRDDDFSWSGQLPKTWLETVANLVSKTRLQPLQEDALDEDDDFWDIALETAQAGATQGTPRNADEWQYLVQELIQAAYELTGREQPFELTYLNLSQPIEQELRLTASFAGRSITIISSQNQRQHTQTLLWSALQRIMSQVYEQDYNPGDALLKRPKQRGQWLNLGTEEWYEISNFRALTKLFLDLQVDKSN